MTKQLKFVKQRSPALWLKTWKRTYRRVAVLLSGVYFKILTSAPRIAYAAKKGANSMTDTGVKDVTDGINVIKELVLGCVGGVGVIFSIAIDTENGIVRLLEYCLKMGAIASSVKMSDSVS